MRCPVPVPLEARRSQVCSRTLSPSAAGPLPQQQQPHSSRVALHLAPVLQRVQLLCEGFEGDSSGQDRALIQCRVCKASGLKLYSSVHRRHANSSCSVFACASDGVCLAPARAGLLSLSRSIVPPLNPLLTIAHQLLLSGSLCNLALQPRSFRGVYFSVRPPHLLIPLKP